MRRPGFEAELASLLAQDRELTVADFFAACPGAPAATVYSKIHSLQERGALSQTGRGRYLAVRKPRYKVPVTDWMLEVNEFLVAQCEGVDHCISQRSQNLQVEVARPDLERVEESLKSRYRKVVRKKEADRFPGPLEGYILVGVLVSDTPLEESSGIVVPSIEKELVDMLCSPGWADSGLAFQRTMEVYSVNVDRMHRYAARRGVAEELAARLCALDQSRIKLFSATQKYLSTIPVLRAWVFGSFARGEETPDSDLDLLVDYDKGSKLSLLDVIRFKNDLEKILGREVDLIENGSLKPFAIPSAERDKYLIYAR